MVISAISGGYNIWFIAKRCQQLGLLRGQIENKIKNETYYREYLNCFF